MKRRTSDTYKPTAADATTDGGVTLSSEWRTYTDAEGLDKMSDGASAANAVALDTRNKAPKFADDQDPDTKGDQADAKRTIAEGSKASESDPLTATDNVGSPGHCGLISNNPEPPALPTDQLTYTLGGARCGLVQDRAGRPCYHKRR